MTEPIRLVLLITGSRDWTDTALLKQKLDDVRDAAANVGVAELVVRHGDCRPVRDLSTRRLPARSADWLAHRWVHDFDHGPIDVFADPMPADWTAPCRPTCPTGHRRERITNRSTCPSAGHYRNQDMIDKDPRPDTAIAFWLNRSRGTADCISRLRQAGIEPDIVEART